MGRFFAAAMTMLVLAGCGAGPTAPDFTTPTVAQLQGVPEFAAVGGVPAHLTSDVYRDFSLILVQGPPPSERGLVAFLRVSSTEGSVLPANLQASRAWVVRSQDIWSAVIVDDGRNSGGTSRDWGIGDGPLWKSGDMVDVVIELKTGGSTIRLRAGDQMIKSLGLE